MRRYNYYGPLEVDKDGLERMAKELYAFHVKITDNLGVQLASWEQVRDEALKSSLDLIKAYHGIAE